MIDSSVRGESTTQQRATATVCHSINGVRSRRRAVSYLRSELWTRTLGGEVDSPSPHVERLRANFLRFREHATHLAAQIATDLPEYTVHDISHIDGLWIMADAVVGASYDLNPLEAFVLGGAFMLHDLAMSSAAFAGGEAELEGNQRWRDALALIVRRQTGRAPTAAELNEPDVETRRLLVRDLLRERHAAQAARLPFERFAGASGEYYLIEDTDLRTTFGALMGNLGASHWADVSQLAGLFPTVLNPIPGMPTNWLVDPLKIACIVRACDAAHITSERAPGFLHTLRRLPPVSERHWTFQGHLQQPRVDGDRLVYTAGNPFSAHEAQAWWTCLDALRMVDSELRQCDALLADTGRDRFAAKSVASVSSPTRLQELIPTDGWVPVDASIRIGDVPGLVRKLGGEELYGPQGSVAVRELIENAADAIRALQALSPRDDRQVVASLRHDSDGVWLVIDDNGIGMSASVMTGALLDFGTSYWGSGLMLDELPGLASTSFTPTGRFGLGFFSVFMLGSRVRVVSRRYDEAHSNTFVLEFGEGTAARPVFRRASIDERRPDGGTEVAVLLDASRLHSDGLLDLDAIERERGDSLYDLTILQFPSLDVRLLATDRAGEKQTVCEPNDWLTISASRLFDRVVGAYRRRGIKDEERQLLCERMRTIEADGHVFGRATFSPSDLYVGSGYYCPITVGGARGGGGLGGAVGVIVGDPVSAARDRAIPAMPSSLIRDWATEQRVLWESDFSGLKEQFLLADFTQALGGDIGGLPVAATADRVFDVADLEAHLEGLDLVLLVPLYVWEMCQEYGGDFELDPSSLLISDATSHFTYWSTRWPLEEGEAASTMDLVHDAVARVWSMDLRDYFSREGADIHAKRPIGSRGSDAVSGYTTVIRRPS